MDFQKLKELAQKIGGILVMDGNEPELVILPYAKYDAGVAAPLAPESADEQAMIEHLNTEIEALKEEIRQKETAELA